MANEKQKVTQKFTEWLQNVEAPVAADYAYSTALYGTDDEYPALAESRARLKAAELCGGPGPEPDVLRGRENDTDQRRQAVQQHARARAAWGGAVAALLGGLESAASFGRAASSVALLFLLVGVLRQGIGWRGWAALGLVASLVIVNLRLAPAIVRFLAGAARASLLASCDQVRAWSLGRQTGRLRSLRLEEEDRRAEIARLVAAALALLLAEYRHHKNLAVKAAAA